MSSRKRRFGISIPEPLARNVDELAKKLSTDRSKIVENALWEYLKDHAHYLVTHVCHGVMVITGRGHSEFRGIIEKYRDIVHSYMHLHVGEECVEIIVVGGYSTRIAELHRELVTATKCRVRYVPVSSEITKLLGG
ncbi:MAG: CopG family transcriptional regulator [Thermoprotei archaeon]|nr:MAG: CopG family transcriptional regulator [Thermoprotei archaeon]